MGSAASLSPRSNPDQTSNLPVEIVQPTSRSRSYSKRLHDEKYSGLPFFDKSFVEKACFLANNDWDRQVFIRYVLGEFWRHRVSPQLREQLARSSLTLKASFEVEDISSTCIFGIQDLEEFWSPKQCRALLLATVLFSFFDFRKNVDFNVVLEQNAPSLPAFVTALCVDDHRHLHSDHLYDGPGSMFFDPEDILSMIAMNCTVEELDLMLMTPDWIDFTVSAIETSPLALSIESPDAIPSVEGISAEQNKSCLMSDDVSSSKVNMKTVFTNSANRKIISSYSESSLQKMQGRLPQAEVRASRGHVLLSPRAISDSFTPSTSIDSSDSNRGSLSSIAVGSISSKKSGLGLTTHFYARLPVKKSIVDGSGFVSGSYSQQSQCSTVSGSPLQKRAQSVHTEVLSEDEESTMNQAQSVGSGCSVQSSGTVVGYMITAAHQVSGGVNEKNALKLVDFALFSLGAMLSP